MALFTLIVITKSIKIDEKVLARLLLEIISYANKELRVKLSF